MIRVVIGQRIREARIEKGLSQDKLGKIIGVSKVTICWYENNQRTPNLENFEKLANSLGVSCDYLLGREITVVAENSNYNIKISQKDLEILSELKSYKDVYRKLYDDPKRIAKLISKKLK